MSYEVISQPFLGRETSLGGFGKRRQMVIVKYPDGRTATMLASEAKKQEKAVSAAPEPVESTEANS